MVNCFDSAVDFKTVLSVGGWGEGARLTPWEGLEDTPSAPRPVVQSHPAGDRIPPECSLVCEMRLTLPNRVGW